MILAGLYVFDLLLNLPVTTDDYDFDMFASSLCFSALLVAIFFSCTGPCVTRMIHNRRLKIVRVVELTVFFFATLIVYFLSYGFVYLLRDLAMGNFEGNEYYSSFVILLYLCSTEFVPTFAFAYHLDLFSKVFHGHTDE